MSLFAWLFIGHLAGDFILQTGWMAKKTYSKAALFVHCIVYSLIIYIAAVPAGGISLLAFFVIFLSHLILDQRSFVRFWVRKINNADDLQWMGVVVDQCFHLLVLALVAQYIA